MSRVWSVKALLAMVGEGKEVKVGSGVRVSETEYEVQSEAFMLELPPSEIREEVGELGEETVLSES